MATLNIKPSIQYAGKTLFYHSTYTYESNKADTMIQQFKLSGRAAACTHSGNKCHLYIELNKDRPVMPELDIRALTIDGCKIKKVTRIKSIHTWIGRVPQHKPTLKALEALLKEVMQTGQMAVYIEGHLKGVIDASEETPLFTNGQELVKELTLGGAVIWSQQGQQKYDEVNNIIRR